MMIVPIDCEVFYTAIGVPHIMYHHIHSVSRSSCVVGRFYPVVTRELISDL
jgi:hypothetical protein